MTADYLIAPYHQLQSDNTHSRRWYLNTPLLEERTSIKYRKITNVLTNPTLCFLVISLKVWEEKIRSKGLGDQITFYPFLSGELISTGQGSVQWCSRKEWKRRQVKLWGLDMLRNAWPLNAFGTTEKKKNLKKTKPKPNTNKQNININNTKLY